MTLEMWLEKFPWESEEQKKGLLALWQWFKRVPNELRTDDTRVACVAAWFIQKDHESNEWWSGVLGDRVGELQDQIRLLQRDIQDLKSQLAERQKN